MNIAIIGAAGYLGSSLSVKFLKKGHKITAVDDLRYNQGALVAPIFLNKNCEFHKADCMDSETDKVIKKADVIYWLAALVGGPACDKNQAEATRINVSSLTWLLDRLSPQQQLIFPCSSSGYGAANTICDETTPMNSISSYGKNKEDAENIVMQHAKATSLRLATVWGYSSRMRLDLLVNDLTFKALKYKKLSLFQGNYRRAYVHIKDVVNILYRMRLDSNIHGEIFNVSGDNATKSDLVDYIKRWLPVEVSYSNQEDYDRRSYYLNTTKLCKLSEFYVPKYTLDNSLQDLIKTYQFLDISDEKYMRNV